MVKLLELRINTLPSSPELELHLCLEHRHFLGVSEINLNHHNFTPVSPTTAVTPETYRNCLPTYSQISDKAHQANH